MRVTVCAWSDTDSNEKQWEALCQHVHVKQSDLVLLPEMPFATWLTATDQVSAQSWHEAIDKHEAWLERFHELGDVIVAGSCPVVRDGKWLNEGFVWWRGDYRPIHHKYYLPDEPDFWEATWYERGDKSFEVVEINGIRFGMLICTEIWFTEHARAYARDGIHILLCPRATEATTSAKWVRGGQVAAVMAGAYCLSSNRRGLGKHGMQWGSHSWIIEPDQGDLIALTDKNTPFLTRQIDLTHATHAKTTYPRYVRE